MHLNQFSDLRVSSGSLYVNLHFLQEVSLSVDCTPVWSLRSWQYIFCFWCWGLLASCCHSESLRFLSFCAFYTLLTFLPISGYFEEERVGRAFALLKCYRTQCGQHCETFPGRQAPDCRILHNLKIFPGWYSGIPAVRGGNSVTHPPQRGQRPCAGRRRHLCSDPDTNFRLASHCSCFLTQRPPLCTFSLKIILVRGGSCNSGVHNLTLPPSRLLSHTSSASEMTYIVSSGALNSTHSLSHTSCALGVGSNKQKSKVRRMT